MTFRITSLLFATLVLNAAVGSFAVPSKITPSADIEARAISKLIAHEARAIVGDQVERREYPKNRLVRRHLGVESRSEHHHNHHSKGSWDIFRSEIEITTSRPVKVVFVVLIHGKHRHRKHCRFRRHGSCTCKHKHGYKKHHGHEHDGEWKGWKQPEYKDSGGSTHEQSLTPNATTTMPSEPPSPSAQNPPKDMKPSPTVDPMIVGGENGGKSAFSVQPPDIPASGSEKLQSEQPLTEQGNVKPPAEVKPIISDATSPKGDNSNGGPNPSFNTSAGAPLDAPAPEKNALVNDKLSPSNLLTSGQGSDTTPDKGAKPNVSPNPTSLNTFAGAPLPPNKVSPSDGPAPDSSGSS